MFPGFSSAREENEVTMPIFKKRPVMASQMCILKKGEENMAVVTGATRYIWHLLQICLVELNFLFKICSYYFEDGQHTILSCTE